jgi:hypothetical protein
MRLHLQGGTFAGQLARNSQILGEGKISVNRSSDPSKLPGTFCHTVTTRGTEKKKCVFAKIRNCFVDSVVPNRTCKDADESVRYPRTDIVYQLGTMKPACLTSDNVVIRTFLVLA